MSEGDGWPICDKCGEQLNPQIGGGWACNNCTVKVGMEWVAMYHKLAKDHPIVRKAEMWDNSEGGVISWTPTDQWELYRVLVAHGMEPPAGGVGKPGYTQIVVEGGPQCEICQTYLTPALKLDEGGRSADDNLDSPDQFMVITGVITDPCLDILHMCVDDGDREVLHPTLMDLEGKRVRITIEVIDP